VIAAPEEETTGVVALEGNDNPLMLLTVIAKVETFAAAFKVVKEATLPVMLLTVKA
jgi:hypothetical protein